MVYQNQAQMINVTYQTNTQNQSFIDMYRFLEAKGIENNKFFLVLYDSDLLNIDPRDPRLNMYYKRKVLAECMRNFWYFIREVCRIPTQGMEVGGGVRYKLHRANLAMNYGFVMNWNMFVEIPRQNGKTVSALCWYLWVFLFGTRNSKIMFLNKKHESSKMNLQTLKDLREALPDYLRLNSEFGVDGKLLKRKNSAETINNPINNNIILTAPAPRNKQLAANLGRGATLPFLYFDEYAFIPFNYVIYETAAPAFSTASKNAREFGSPYGILITTTPGDMLTAEGREGYLTKETATKFNELWYNCNMTQLNEIVSANKDSNFIYMRYTYKELGRTDEYFQEMVKTLKSNWTAIRREVLLEWAETTENSPFEKNDLDMVKRLIRKPIKEIWIGKPIYVFKIYKDDCNFYKHPPIIGVDVSGGLSRDSSAITIIDSETTEVIATFNSNCIPIQDLARVLYDLVKTRMPNAVVNIERNGGFGASLLTQLLEPKLNFKRNLYYEVKERVFEERQESTKNTRHTRKVRVYGLDETKNVRKLLTEELLNERMQYHKDKFVSEDIYKELTMLEVKKNGRIEHTSDGHDDQVFSYLLALYVWYYGKNVSENWQIKKSDLRTDEEFEVAQDMLDDNNTALASLAMEMIVEEEESELSMQLKEMKKIKLSSDIEEEFEAEKEKTLEKLLRNPVIRKGYARQYHEDEENLCSNSQYVDITDAINEFQSDLFDEPVDTRSALQKEFDNLTDLR